MSSVWAVCRIEGIDGVCCPLEMATKKLAGSSCVRRRKRDEQERDDHGLPYSHGAILVSVVIG